MIHHDTLKTRGAVSHSKGHHSPLSQANAGGYLHSARRPLGTRDLVKTGPRVEHSLIFLLG